MHHISSCFTLLICLLVSQACTAQQSVLTSIDSQKEKYHDIAHQIWTYAELGYQEEKSSALLKQTLSEAGFSIEEGVADIPTAFVASYGSGSPVIGILAEYDALPGISQDAVPERKEIVSGGNGHACGHHLFGTASTSAAISIAEWLQSSGHQGTIKLIGTPAEEGGAGKVYMVRAGIFDDIDAVLHWHPGSQNSAGAFSSLANTSAKFRFYGVASHAAVAPQNGRSALDGVEAMNYMVNLMREHVSSDARIHYVITSGGEAPNVVPEFAEVYYYVRHPNMQVAKEAFDRVVQAAEGAALGTETRMEYEIIHGVYNLMPNETLSRVVHDNLVEIGGFTYDANEQAFAEKIKPTLPERSQRSLLSTSLVAPFRVVEKGGGGSTDVGDISWVVPTAGLSTATWVPGTSAHTWQAVAAGGMSIGHKGMILAAKTLATAAIDLIQHPETISDATAELQRRVGKDFVYMPLLGDREPPLDYRK
jgi:aminobenzoyl-glutamate utilization protein B